MKTTYQKLVEFNNLARQWLAKAPENKDTKLGYAISKNLKKTDKLLKPVFELDEQVAIKIEDIRSDNALTDDKGRFIYDVIKDKDGNEKQMYCYTPETRKKRDTEIREAITKHSAAVEKLLSEEVEFSEPYFAAEVPLLTYEEKEAFIGIVINPLITSIFLPL